MKVAQLKIGQVSVTSFCDVLETKYMDEFFPDVLSKQWEPYYDMYPERLSGHRLEYWGYTSYLIESSGKRILVDCGVGGDNLSAVLDASWNGDLLTSLEEAGYSAESIDMVALTHLHQDHVGWCVTERNGLQLPTFPNAQYYAHRGDWDLFKTRDVQEGFVPGYFYRTVSPLMMQNRLHLIEIEEFKLTDEVAICLAPGHTEGSCVIRVESEGKKGLFIGDLCATPVQLAEPDWVFCFDRLPDSAQAARINLLDWAGEGAVLGAAHFGMGILERKAGKMFLNEVSANHPRGGC